MKRVVLILALALLGISCEDSERTQAAETRGAQTTNTVVATTGVAKTTLDTGAKAAGAAVPTVTEAATFGYARTSFASSSGPSTPLSRTRMWRSSQRASTISFRSWFPMWWTPAERPAPWTYGPLPCR